MRLASLALITACAAFAAVPDFSGDWKMNASKSDFGQFPAPTNYTQKVTHSDPKLTVETKMGTENGDFNMTSNYTTDGKECTNKGFRDSETKSVLKWDGPALVIETKGSFGDNSYTMTDKWTLSADGKVLTVNRKFASSMGEMEQKMVLEKQ